MPGKKQMCRHCEKCKVNRPRGLCWSCYYTPGVIELYPPTSKYANRGVGLGVNPVQLGESAPTEFPPGSRERIEVLAVRAALNAPIFHNLDARDWEGSDATPPQPEDEGRQNENVDCTGRKNRRKEREGYGPRVYKRVSGGNKTPE